MIIECTVCHKIFDITNRSIVEPFVCDCILPMPHKVNDKDYDQKGNFTEQKA